MIIHPQPPALPRAATPESNPRVLFGPKFIFRKRLWKWYESLPVLGVHVHRQQGGMGTFQIPAVGYEELGGCASFSPILFVIVAREIETAQNNDVTGGGLF